MAEVYDHFLGPDHPGELDDWYNLADDLMFRAPGVEGDRQLPPDEMTPAQKEAYRSFEQCGQACAEYPRCFQYVYYEQTCGFSFSYRLGERRLPAEGMPKYKSGWDLSKIAQDQRDHSCISPEWG
jgi:hypothetical protein